jgi:UDP-2-acetamido-2-deoxy-ribo-hexuluronate aminotransferase
MQINFLDLKKNYLSIKEDIDNEFTQLFNKCDFIHGEKVKIFEKKFSEYLGVKHFIGCANGTDALEIAIMSLDLNNDDEIIVQGNTYIATCLGVVNNNIKLVYSRN